MGGFRKNWQIFIISDDVFLVVSKIFFQSKISHFHLFLVMSKETQKIFSKFYIDIYLLRQYLHILTHPIIHFLHFGHCIQFFFNISRKNFLLRADGGVLTPKTPLAYASGSAQVVTLNDKAAIVSIF